ncbi:putative AbiEi antitoxin of type IV toxin-antitoxin system [Kribbella amoyensis]|uniref:Putative AbiEi antitoxin of type IV toxin-antitoxin system n=2 Tax=Kribbella amoyensis TaxID=996641 RepID=A0A561BMP0_9ACTN|nr:putative AbiEi antitoxin of type IV toxin-antitoxin system [Kribbella amoyensis]
MTTIRGGVFTRADARACGYPDPDIDTLLESGGWRRIRPGTYAPYRDFAVVGEHMQHLRRTYRVLRDGDRGQVASHQSAAALHALPVWGLDLADVQVTARTPAPMSPGVCRHVRDPLGPGVQVWNNLRLTSAPRAVAEVAATSPFEAAVAVAEAALAAGLATPGTLRKAAAELVAGADQANLVASRAQPKSASVAESRLRLILAEAGLPLPSSSSPPADELDLSGCTLWFPDERTVVEFEPRYPYWCEVDADAVEEAAARFFDAGESAESGDPAPLEYCWISWADLDNPQLVVHRVQATFSRAMRRTGVRAFDPNRPRRRRRRPEITLLPAHDLSS